MRKYIAGIVTLVLAIALIVSFVPFEIGSSQGSKSNSSKKTNYDTDSIVGDWEGMMYPSSSYTDSGYGIYMTFEDDGTYTVSYDVEEYVDYLIEESQAYYELQGEDFDEYLEKQGYDSLEDYRQAGIDEMSEETNYDGTYEFDGETFMLGDDECYFEFDGYNFEFEAFSDVIELERV